MPHEQSEGASVESVSRQGLSQSYLLMHVKIPNQSTHCIRQFEGDLINMNLVHDPKSPPPVSIFGFQVRIRPQLPDCCRGNSGRKTQNQFNFLELRVTDHLHPPRFPSLLMNNALHHLVNFFHGHGAHPYCLLFQQQYIIHIRISLAQHASPTITTTTTWKMEQQSWCKISTSCLSSLPTSPPTSMAAHLLPMPIHPAAHHASCELIPISTEVLDSTFTGSALKPARMHRLSSQFATSISREVCMGAMQSSTCINDSVDGLSAVPLNPQGRTSRDCALMSTPDSQTQTIDGHFPQLLMTMQLQTCSENSIELGPGSFKVRFLPQPSVPILIVTYHSTNRATTYNYR